MKQIPIYLSILFFITAALSADSPPSDTTHITVTKTGRKILFDGFLMEWKTQSARTWDTAGSWVWDVVATPEGLAGYLRLQSAEICSTWNISIRSSVESQAHYLRLPGDSSEHDKTLRFDRAEFDSMGTVTVEWLFPYGADVPNSSTPMFLTFNAGNSCNVSLPILELSYTPQPVKTGTRLTIIGQGLMILILALLYFAVQRKIRHQTQRQKESPHQ